MLGRPGVFGAWALEWLLGVLCTHDPQPPEPPLDPPLWPPPATVVLVGPLGVVPPGVLSGVVSGVVLGGVVSPGVEVVVVGGGGSV
jgi:hypothetical protein